MKSIWIIVSTIALANLLAFGSFVGWLTATDRLDAARIERVRQLLAETLAEEKAREAAEQAQAEAQRVEAEQAAKDATPPRRAGQILAEQKAADEVDRQRVERLRREVDDLKRTLQGERERLDRDLASFKAERDEFKAMRERLARVEGSEQFKKTLGVYSSLKPGEAKTALMQLIREGVGLVDDQPPATTGLSARGTGDVNVPAPARAARAKNEAGTEQAVAYLNAMDEDRRTKIIREVIKDDPALAAELLERVRTRGIEGRTQGTPRDRTSSSATQPAAGAGGAARAGGGTN